MSVSPSDVEWFAAQLARIRPAYNSPAHPAWCQFMHHCADWIARQVPWFDRGEFIAASHR